MSPLARALGAVLTANRFRPAFVAPGTKVCLLPAVYVLAWLL